MSQNQSSINLESSYQEIVKKVLSYFPEADIHLLRKAYEFARDHHQHQKRKSGEPYITHPLAVANILAIMKLDLISIIAGLIHDTVEDTEATLEDVEKLFGKDCMKLVDGVTKISKISFNSSHEKQAENFRKMLLAMAKDLRVILIKLADRTHNMRTLSHMKEEKKSIIAQETLDIYAPLANRLGISWMKIELEDLGLRFTKPEVYYNLSNLVEKKKNEREKYISTVKSIIEEKLNEYGLKSLVTGRAKHFYSILKKMEARDSPFEEIHDVIAFRIITQSIAECYEALGIVHSFYKPVPGRFKDFIAMAKNNLYQSLHTTVIGPFSERLEIQIRTEEMHKVAESGIAAHWKYKDGQMLKKDYEKFQWLRQLLDDQEEIDNPVEFIESVKLDLFSKDVYVFTPKGELLEFPFGSTPIDFAFSIHTDIGMKCTGAKVNGRIVNLKHKLRSGDVVEVTTSPNQNPNKDWLKSVKTSKAQTKIRAYIRSEERLRSKQIGQDLLDKELRKIGKGYNKFLKTHDFEQKIQKLSYANFDEMLIALGYGKMDPDKIINIFYPDEKPQQSKVEKKKTFLQEIFSKANLKQKNQPSRNVVRISGADDVLVRYGSCCTPLPGDEITGYITRGRGVTIHKLNCSKVLELDSNRSISVEWTENTSLFKQSIKIKVTVSDQSGLINEMSRVINELGLNISSLNISVNKNNKGTGIFSLEIQSKAQLAKCIRALESLTGVISVERAN